MHPLRFVKEHPAGFALSAVTGMIAGPWVIGTIQRYTGISLSLPTLGGGGNAS